jgi:hypothetical protein
VNSLENSKLGYKYVRIDYLSKYLKYMEGFPITHGTKNPLSFGKNLNTAMENK